MISQNFGPNPAKFNVIWSEEFFAIPERVKIVYKLYTRGKTSFSNPGLKSEETEESSKCKNTPWKEWMTEKKLVLQFYTGREEYFPQIMSNKQLFSENVLYFQMHNYTFHSFIFRY